jgi:hypothetical protein
MVGDETPYGMLYDYGLTHRMFGANMVAKYYMSPVNLTVGVNGYSFARDHFLDDKSVGVDDYYSNRGVKTDVSTFVMLQYKPIKGMIISGNVLSICINYF